MTGWQWVWGKRNEPGDMGHEPLQAQGGLASEAVRADPGGAIDIAPSFTSTGGQQVEKTPADEPYIQRISELRPLMPSLIAARRW